MVTVAHWVPRSSLSFFRPLFSLSLSLAMIQGRKKKRGGHHLTSPYIHRCFLCAGVLDADQRHLSGPNSDWSTNRRCSPNPTDINKSTVNSISTRNNWGIGAFLPVLFLLLQSIAPGHLRPTPCGQQLLNCVQGAWRCLGEADLKNRVGSRCTVTKMKEDKHNVQSF